MNEMPASPPPQPKYVSHVPSRGWRGTYKFHKTLGHAKSALVNGGYGTIWEWIDDAWVILYHVEKRTARDNMPWNIEKSQIEEQRRADAARAAAKRRVVEMMKEIEGL